MNRKRREHKAEKAQERNKKQTAYRNRRNKYKKGRDSMSGEHQHEWVVFSTALQEGWLMLQCEICGSQGTVDDPTREEWRRAYHAPSAPYRWVDDSRVTVRRSSSAAFFVVPRQPGANCSSDCPHRQEVGNYERVPAGIIRPFRTLSDEERRELAELADFVQNTDLCSTLLPAFLEGSQADTGHEPSGAVRHIAEGIGAIHRKGLHFRPAIVAFVLREFARISS
jgi:hypothetical protein